MNKYIFTLLSISALFFGYSNNSAFAQDANYQAGIDQNSISQSNIKIYAPQTQKLNAIDSAALNTYCSLSKVFNKNRRDKCFVGSGYDANQNNQANNGQELNILKQDLEDQRQEIEFLKSRPTSTEIIKEVGGKTIVKYVNAGSGANYGARGSNGIAGKDGKGISSTKQNTNGTITFYYTDGTSFTTTPINTTSTSNSITASSGNLFGVPVSSFNTNYAYQYVPVSGGGSGATGAQGPAGAAGVGISSITQTATGTLFTLTNGAVTQWSNNFTNATITNATMTSAAITNANITNVSGSFVQNDLVINNGKIETGAPLTRNTDTSLAGFSRTWTGLGNFGIGTSTPNEKLTVDGNVQLRNQDSVKWGSNGVANVDANNNINLGSFNILSGLRALTAGVQNTATGDDSAAIGVANNSTGDYSYAIGRFNTASNTASLAVGNNNKSEGVGSGSFGASNTASGLESYALGNENAISGATSFGVGQLNKVTTNNSGVSGYFNTVLSASSYVYGASNTVANSAVNSYTFGSNITNNIASSTQIGTSNSSKLFIGADGFVGIASSTFGGARTSRLADEQLRVGGRIKAHGFDVDTAADLAENFPADEEGILPGHIVQFSDIVHKWNTGGTDIKNEYDLNGVERAKVAKSAIGVIATNPGIVLGSNTKGLPVAFSGRVPVRVSAESGQVVKGDRVTLSSSEAGVGAKLLNAGQSVGIALSSDIGKGMVLMLVKNEYVYDPTLLLENKNQSNLASNSTISNTNISNLSTSDNTESSNTPASNSNLNTSTNDKLCIQDLCIDKSMLQKIIDFVNNFIPSSIPVVTSTVNPVATSAPAN